MRWRHDLQETRGSLRWLGVFGGLGWGGRQFLINCQSLSQNHVGLGDPDLHSGFQDRLFGHLAEDLTLSWSDARFIAWQHQNRRSEAVALELETPVG